MLNLFFFFANTASARDYSTIGVIDDNSPTTRLIVVPLPLDPDVHNGGTSIVFGSGFNTSTYQNFYSFSNLQNYYNSPELPYSFVEASSVPDEGYATRQYNVYNLVVKGAGTFEFQVTDPAYPVNKVGASTIDLMAALYVKSGVGVAFDPANTLTNLVALSDDNSRSGSSNPFPLFYQNTSNTDCVALSLVYFPWGSASGSVNITASGPGQIASSCSQLVSAPNTQSSMQYQARQLRSAFNTQTVAANFALNYDCTLFDVKGMCISAGGRYTTIDNPNINNSAAVVTLGYKVNPNIRIGAYLDQNINISNPSGIDISNNTPLMGLYAVWNKEQSGLGYQVRLANTYQDKDVTQTRTVFDTSEAGSGKTSLKSQSYLAELSYAFQYEDKTLVRPYAGLRYTHLKQDGYTEATVTGSVDNPLTVAALRDKGTTALLGVKVNRSLTDKATLTAQLGLEQDLHHKVDQYSATNSDIGDLSSIAFNSNIKRTRPVASIGAFYDVTKTQRASATINYLQTPFHSTGSTTAYFNYMIGF